MKGAYAKTGTVLLSYYNDDSGKPWPIIGLDVWYSPACHAGWAEFREIDPEYNRHFYKQTFYIPANGGPEKYVDAGTLVNWDNSIKSCGSDEQVDPDLHRVEEGGCTAWV